MEAGVAGMIAGRFLAGEDGEQVLVVEKVGQVEVIPVTEKKRMLVDIVRLCLLRLQDKKWEVVWWSGEMLGARARAAGLALPVWTTGDVDGDSLLEVVVILGDSCRIYHFATDGVGLSRAFLPAGEVVEAVWADVDADGAGELVTLEKLDTFIAEEGEPATPRIKDAVRVWQERREEMVAVGGPLFLPEADSGLNFFLLGCARMEDYPGMPVIFGGEYPQLRPGIYGVLFARSGDSFALTTTPFPRAEWFRKDVILPAGRLALFNAGDTLIAYGYFVPGSRPGGPPRSFAALVDGDWRLLPLRDFARRLSGPVCRFSYQGQAGFLELRERSFYFYPQVPFYWR